MAETSTELLRIGKKAIKEMLLDGCRKSVVYVYDGKTPIGTVTVQPGTFDPYTGD